MRENSATNGDAVVAEDPRVPICKQINDLYKGKGRYPKRIDWKQVWEEHPEWKVALEFDESNEEERKRSLARIGWVMKQATKKGKKYVSTRKAALALRKYDGVELAAHPVPANAPQATSHFCPKCGTLSVAIENREAQVQQQLIERALTLAGRVK